MVHISRPPPLPHPRLNLNNTPTNYLLIAHSATRSGLATTHGSIAYLKKKRETDVSKIRTIASTLLSLETRFKLRIQIQVRTTTVKVLFFGCFCLFTKTKL